MSTAAREPLNMTNGSSVALEAIPDLSWSDFESALLAAVAQQRRVVALFAAEGDHPEALNLYAVLADDASNQLAVARTPVEDDRFPSLAVRCPQVHLFEREIAEQFGVLPVGHPWLKPVRFRKSWRPGRDAWGRKPDEPIEPGVMDFYRVEGAQVHEVAVGPVHAGVIEPGHFRFQCHGEEVFHLEISLGYQHRGVEEALKGGPTKRSIHYAETLAGDTTIAHATAYCQVLEALAHCRQSARAQTLRGIALELERLANHVGDLGALAGDVAFLPTASFCGRIRGDILNMTALLCGNRFGRGMIRPGGVGFDVDGERVTELLSRLGRIEKDAGVAIKLLWDTPSVMARFEDTGQLPRQVAAELGIVGPAARASGLARDARHDQPAGIYLFAQVPVSTYDAGDVLGRAYVRFLEVQQSLAFVREQLGALPPGERLVELGSLAPRRLAIALNEGWRGEVVHLALTDAAGRFSRYKVGDPSFHNWAGLAYVLRGQPISDFPLCNKSFNLSYCGHDL